MTKKIINDLQELHAAGIINEETAQKIHDYYNVNSTSSSNRLTLVFSILGATLIGSGIILIVAHNWDNLGKSAHTVLAFLPLIIGQMLCGFTLLKRKESIAWREASSTFLFFAVGTCIALISQIYNLGGDLSSFLLTWSLLCLPLVYLMRSSMVSLLYIAYITWYATLIGYDYPGHPPYLYIGLLLLLTPYIYQLFQTHAKSNFFNFHCWLIIGSLCVTLGTFSDGQGELMWIAYISLFSIFILISRFPQFAERRIFGNPFLVIGVLGIVVSFLINSSTDLWEYLSKEDYDFSSLFSSPEFWTNAVLILLAITLIIKNETFHGLRKIHPLAFGFIVYSFAFFIGILVPMVGIILCNVFLLWAAIYYINRGKEEDHLGLLNLGLVIITALIIVRFFDYDISFVTRGIMFILVGIGFFIANHQILKRRKEIQA